MPEKATMTFEAFETEAHLRPSYATDKYLALPEDERVKLFLIAKRFMVNCSKMGPSSALELLLNLGTWQNDPDPRKSERGWNKDGR